MGYQEYETLKVTVEDGVATVLMNRPELLNAFNSTMRRELLRIPDELRDDPEVRVVILTGAGRGFSSGADGTEPRGNSTDLLPTKPREDPLSWAGRVAIAWHNLDKFSIAAINGVAVGGGLALALFTDIRTMADSARLMPIFMNLGNSPEMGSSWYIPRLAGLPRALEWLCTGDTLFAAEAERIGVVNHVFPAESLLEETMKIARKVAGNPPMAVRLSRRDIYHGLQYGLAEHLPYEVSNVMICIGSEDAKEARLAAAEKRKPVFVGR